LPHPHAGVGPEMHGSAIAVAILFGATSAQAAAAQRAATTIPAQAEAPFSKQRRDSLTQLLTNFGHDPQGRRLPSADSVTFGGRAIAADSHVKGPVVVAGGNLDVYGTIEGDAIAVSGNVVVHSGGRVTGDALAGSGEVKLDGGTVDGEIRALGGDIGRRPGAPAEAQTSTTSTRHALSLALAWLGIVALIGIGVLVFASSYLDGVVEALTGNFTRSLLAGIAAELAMAPALILLIAALALTIIGLLLVPFAIVAFVLAVAGLVTLGFLGVARMTGESISPSASQRLSVRGSALRAVVLGVALYLGMWVVAAAFTWLPIAGGVLRGVAFVVTWVAATAGLGAAIQSRAGTRRAAEPPEPAARINEVGWQTPTPVTGVVAARRPASAGDRR
jgi:cytoskeletal protein CcmA (bactofilin family)